MHGFYKKILVALAALFVLLLAVDFGLQFAKFNHLKKEIIAEVEKQHKVKLRFKGDVKLKLLPLPHFQFQGVNLKTMANQSLLKSPKVSIYPKSYIFWTQKPMLANTGKIKIYHANINFSNIDEFQERDSLLRDSLFPSLELIDSVIERNIDGKYNVTSNCITKLNAHIKFSPQQFYTEAMFEFNNEPINMLLTLPFAATSKDATTLQVFNQAMEINFIGDTIAIEQSVQEVKGNVEMKVLDFEKLMAQINANLMLGKILKNENLVLKANLQVNKEQLKIDNLNINSKNIKDAHLTFYLNYLKDLLLELKINVTSVNFDAMVHDIIHDNSTFQIVDSICLWLMQKFDFAVSPKLAFNANLNINEIVFNQAAIKDLKLQADGLSGDIQQNNGNIAINSMSMQLPDGGAFSLNGVISHNEIRPKFEGDIQIQSKEAQKLLKWFKVGDNKNIQDINNIEIKTKITLIPHSIRLDDIRAAIGQYIFIGDLNLREGSDQRINYLAQLRFNNINADNFGIGEIIDDIITKLYISDPDRTGEVHTKLTNDFRWLRTIHNNFDLDISINEMLFKNKKYRDCNFVFAIGANKFALERIAFTSDLARMHGFISLILPTFRPYIDINMAFDFLDTQFLSDIFPSFKTLDEAVNKYYTELAVIEEKQTTAENNDKQAAIPSNSSPNELLLNTVNFFGANNYDGKIKFKAQNLIHDKTNYDKIDISVVLNNGVLLIDKSSFNGFNGSIVFNGNITLLSAIPSIAISFALHNVDPGLLTETLFNFNKIKGYMSVSGSMSTSGTSINNMLQRLQAEMLVVGKRIVIQGFDLGEMIGVPDLDMSLVDQNKRLQYYTQYGETIFDNLKGKISVAGGMADFTNFALDNNRASGSFSARYSLMHKLINSIVRFSFIPIGTAKPLNIQYTAKGHLDNLEVEASLTELQKYITNKAVARGENVTPSAVNRESVLKKRLK